MAMKIVFLFILIWNNAAVFGLVGGTNVSVLKAPFQANYADSCGAVIIHTRWTLTTAHCGASGTFIRVGSTHRLTGFKIQILNHLIHPKFETNEFDYDIQLLKLFKELRFGSHVRSVAICEGKCGKDLEVFGWGYSEERGDYNPHLQMIQVHVVPDKECLEAHSQALWQDHALTDRMFCAKGIGQDACQGDSGGAATSSGYLLGLSSFGYGCGRDMPGVYTSVTHRGIRSWIKYHTGI